jgi:hypothetical protein
VWGGGRGGQAAGDLNMSSSSLKSWGRLVECQSWPGVGEWGCHYSLCPCFLMSLMLVQAADSSYMWNEHAGKT